MSHPLWKMQKVLVKEGKEQRDILPYLIPKLLAAETTHSCPTNRDRPKLSPTQSSVLLTLSNLGISLRGHFFLSFSLCLSFQVTVGARKEGCVQSSLEPNVQEETHLHRPSVVWGDFWLLGVDQSIPSKKYMSKEINSCKVFRFPLELQLHTRLLLTV